MPYTWQIATSASQDRLEKLIAERLAPGADRDAIDARIWALFGETWAVMFTDLSGFSRRVAQELVYQTIEGSVAIARETGAHPTELRNRVTSPGGTSAEALYQLEKGGLRTVISRGVWAAYQRAKSLGELSEK